jgi:iron complex transport system permease protein
MVLPAALLLAVSSGTVPLSLAESLGGVWSTLLGEADRSALIIGQIRLPRVLLAAAIGSILAISGAAMQGLFRNPLADPSLIGVTAGASLGASIAIVAAGSAGPISSLMGSSGYLGLTVVSLGAFVGGLIAVTVVYRLASNTTHTSVATMLLAGIAITALAGAVVSLLELHSSNEILRRISLWRMGGLDGANYSRLLLASCIAVALLVYLPRQAGALNALLLGESEARYLGIDVEKTKRGLILWVAIGVGTSVALAGTIAFVGLVVPHIIRMLIGPDHRYLLIASALAGAILLVLADTIARVAMSPAELPVGIVTALVGAPFFISLLRKRGQYGMQ